MLVFEGLTLETRNKLEGDIWEGWNVALEVEDRIDVAVKGAIAELEAVRLLVLRAVPKANPGKSKPPA